MQYNNDYNNIETINTITIGFTPFCRDADNSSLFKNL